MKAAAYCVFTYLVTVVFLLSPFLFVNNVFVALGIALFIGVWIVGIFNFYYSVTKEEKFWKRFLHMAIISFSVAGISFLIGMLLKHFTGIQV